MSVSREKLPGFFHHIALLWRLRITMSNNSVNRWGRYGHIISGLLVAVFSVSLAGVCYWFMTHPSVSLELAVSQFYLNLLCFVTALLWILWPVLSAGVEDGSERDRYLQFPISESRLLSASIVSGVLKPVGFLMFAPLIGASFGYLKGQGALFNGWALVLIFGFIAMCATWSQAGVYLLRDLLRAKGNGKALTLTLLICIVIGMLLPQVDISWLYSKAGGVGVSDASELEEFANIAHAFSKVPPGYLGEGLLALVEGRQQGVQLEAVAMLVLAYLGLLNAKYRLTASTDKSASYQSLQQHQWLLFTLKGKVDIALAQRELFELWRNPRFRLLAIVPFFLMVVLHQVSANELLHHFFGDISRLWLMAGFGNYAAALILLTFTHNTFAYDGRGLLNLMNAPITPEQLIRAKARVHQLVSLGAGVLASLFCWLYVAPSASAGWVCVAIMGVLVVVPIVTTVGLWVSVQYPIKFDASLNRRERQPLLVSIAGFAGVLLGSIPLLIAVRFIQAGGALDSALLTLIVAALLVWFIHCKMLVRISLAFSRRQSEVLSAITRV